MLDPAPTPPLPPPPPPTPVAEEPPDQPDRTDACDLLKPPEVFAALGYAAPPNAHSQLAGTQGCTFIGDPALTDPAFFDLPMQTPASIEVLYAQKAGRSFFAGLLSQAQIEWPTPQVIAGLGERASSYERLNGPGVIVLSHNKMFRIDIADCAQPDQAGKVRTLAEHAAGRLN